MSLPEQISERIQELGQTGCGVTDHGAIWGHSHFHSVFRKKNLRAVLGMEAYHVENRLAHIAGAKGKRTTNPRGHTDIAHLTLLAKNQTGYKNLLQLVDLSSRDGYRQRPAIDWEDVFAHQEGLIVLTGCVGGMIPRLLYAEDHQRTFNLERGKELAHDWLVHLRERIENLVVEICPVPGLGKSVQSCRELWGLAELLNLPRVLTDDAHFVRPEDSVAQDSMLCVQSHQDFFDETRKLRIGKMHYRCSGEDIVERAERIMPAVAREELIKAAEYSCEIASSCEVEIPKPKGPQFAVPLGLTADDLLARWIEEGKAYRRELGLLPAEGTKEWQIYEERLAYELGILRAHTFQNYFLIVTDLVKWSKSKKYWCIARGSCGGSLICFYLSITQIDPIKLKLPVERFISFHRGDLPDIDLDYDARYRDRAFKYLEEKYGAAHVAQIAALSTFRAKQALNDVAKVHRIPREVVDEVLKHLPEVDAEEGIKARGRLEGLFQQEDGIQHLLKKYPALKLAASIEGEIKTQSIHAAGVVVDQNVLAETIGVITQRGEKQKDGTYAKGPRILACDMQQVAAQGFLKIDILSVEMLSTITEVLDAIGEDHDWLYRLPLDDTPTYKMLGGGSNQGVFQMKGHTAGKLLVQLQPTEFNDLVALAALARPGPLQSGGAQEYIDRKHEREQTPHYHPAIAGVLTDTYGVILFQEQVMLFMREVGNFEWPDVDKIRKLISKSGGAVAMEKYYEPFMESALSHGVPETETEHVWNQCQRAGNYLFNRCLTGDTVVTRPNHSNGGPITIAELYQAQQSKTAWGSKIRSGYLNLMQMGEDRRVRPDNLKAVYYQGRREVFEIITDKGHRVKATNNHRFLTDNGYRTVEEIVVGERVVVVGDKETRQKKGFSSERARGKSYDQEGFPNGVNNPSWIDGRTDLFDEGKNTTHKRSGGRCEICGRAESGRFEYAHLISLDMFEWDYKKYHSPDNLRFLCNPCHKKLDYQLGVRKKRYSKGLPTECAIVASIESVGEEDVYDIEMATTEHNFIANGFVSHNSHGAAYALVGYWSAYLKCHHPALFACIAANHEHKEEYQRQILREFQANGGTLKLLDPNTSGVRFTNQGEDVILGGFMNIKGVGESTAQKLVEGRPYRGWNHFLTSCPSSMARDLHATGVAKGNLDLDTVLALAPWCANVVFSLKEEAAFERMKCIPCSEARELMREGRPGMGVRLLGRITDLSISVGKHSTATGDNERCSMTLTDPSGSVDVWFSGWRWSEVKSAREPLRGGTEGLGNTLYVVATLSKDRTRFWGGDAIRFRESQAQIDPRTKKLIAKEVRKPLVAPSLLEGDDDGSRTD